MRIATSVVVVLCTASKAAAGRCLTNLSQVSFTYTYPYGRPIPYTKYYKDTNPASVLNNGDKPTAITKWNVISMHAQNQGLST